MHDGEVGKFDYVFCPSAQLHGFPRRQDDLLAGGALQ
jgi:hypothetical protein